MNGLSWKWVFMFQVKLLFCVTWPYPTSASLPILGLFMLKELVPRKSSLPENQNLFKRFHPLQLELPFLNYDDPLVRAMADKTSARVFFYGLDPAADLWADEIEGLGLEGIQFRLHYQNETLYMKVPLIGQHSVHTAMRAAAVGLAEELTWQEIIDGLNSGHAQLRLVAVRSESGALMLDDTYNASPESSLSALNLLADLDGRKLAVIGDMLELGQYEKQGHEMVGVRAAQVSDHLITVGERSHIIAQAAQAGRYENDRIHEFENTDDVTKFLRNFLTSQRCGSRKRFTWGSNGSNSFCPGETSMNASSLVLGIGRFKLHDDGHLGRTSPENFAPF